MIRVGTWSGDFQLEPDFQFEPDFQLGPDIHYDLETFSIWNCFPIGTIPMWKTFPNWKSGSKNAVGIFRFETSMEFSAREVISFRKRRKVETECIRNTPFHTCKMFL